MHNRLEAPNKRRPRYESTQMSLHIQETFYSTIKATLNGNRVYTRHQVDAVPLFRSLFSNVSLHAEYGHACLLPRAAQPQLCSYFSSLNSLLTLTNPHRSPVPASTTSRITLFFILVRTRRHNVQFLPPCCDSSLLPFGHQRWNPR